MTQRKYNYHPYIDEYMRMVENDEINACKDQKKLMEFLRWKLDQPGVNIDAEAIEKSVSVPEKYFPFKLFPWQKFVNAFIYGVKKNGEFLFSSFYIMLGRGAGKNGYISYNSFYMLSKAHGIPNYDIDIVSVSESQAKTSFEDVYNVLDDNWSKLQKSFYHSKTLIQNKSTKSKLEYNTSNARTKDGKRSAAIIFDEIHEFSDYDNIKVFTSGLGKKPFPRIMYLTTNGNLRGAVLDNMLEQSQMILNKELPESTLFPFICRLDEIKEVDSMEMWEKANPSLPYLPHLQKQMKQEYNDMQFNSAMRTEFLTKRMNLIVEDVRKEVATYEDRKATDQEIPDLTRCECIGGVDYAQIRDFCSVGLLFKKDGKRYWLHHTFMHHTAPQTQAINQDIINLGIEKGLIEVVYDKSIDASHVVDWFIKMAKKYNIKKIAMDTHRAAILKEKFEEHGFEIEVVRRGVITHSILSPMVDEMFIKQSIVFGDDPVMRWMVGNVYKDEKGNGNIEYKKIDKEKRKTDGFFAFLHALNFDEELNDLVPLTAENVSKAFQVFSF